MAGSCTASDVEAHNTAFRLFNGFLEGDPDLAIDVYGRTLLVHNYADDPAGAEAAAVKAQQAWQFLHGELPWLQVALVKTRSAPAPAARRGVLLAGSIGQIDKQVCEDGAWYALDLTMHQDASLYLDTRLLRRWLKANLAGKSVLNAFAYTGSLGVAALAGGADACGAARPEPALPQPGPGFVYPQRFSHPRRRISSPAISSPKSTASSAAANCLTVSCSTRPSFPSPTRGGSTWSARASA